MKLIRKITALLLALMLLFTVFPVSFTAFADEAETNHTECPDGDGDVYIAPRYLAGANPGSLAGKTPLDMNVFVRSLLEKAGKGYSQASRYDVNYYDCSSLIQRCFRDLGITGNVPASTYYWYEMLENSPVGDTVTFYGANTYAQYRLTARNITMQGNESYFVKPGTIIVLIAPELCTGHICVSLGAFQRQDEGLDPAADRSTIIQNTEDYVAAQLEATYGVPASLFTNPGAVSGVRSIWMDDRNLGEDMTTKSGTQSGAYNPIWRVEAFNASKGVCVDNCAHGTNYTLNVRYVLEPVNSDTVIDAAPEITDVTVSDVTPEGYRVTVKFTAPAGLRQVQMPTWTEANGQDDLIWHTAELEDENTAYFDVKVSDHKNETGAYITHIYVTDLLGRKAIKGVNVTVPESGSQEPEAMGFTDAWVTDVTEDGYKVHAEFAAPNGVSEILAETWTEANGQDDLVRHQIYSYDGKTLEYYVRTADHHNESGLYLTHIYLKDPKGNEITAAVSADVPEPKPQEKLEITSINASELSLGGGYWVSITYTAPMGVREVLMPTWTVKNGQDDLVWHKAEIHEEANMANLFIDSADHNNELGDYITHVYLYDNTGAYVIEPVTITLTKEKQVIKTVPRITDLVVSDVTQYGFRVTATIFSTRPIKEVLMPTWTEANGQDDLIWYKVPVYERSDGYQEYGATYYVSTKDHKNERGQYITHVYVTDEAGEQDLAGTGAFVPIVQGGPRVTEVTVSDVTSEGYTVIALLDSPNGIDKVLMPTWTDNNWQDDVIWYNAEVNGNAAYLHISTADHNNETGQYTTHIYVYDKVGNYVIEKVYITVPDKEEKPPVIQEELRITDLVITELSADGYRVTATFTAPNGVSEVLMPTWTEANGQDDLIWHKATVSGNTATYYVRKVDHKNESGQYITHVYVKDPTGKQAIAATGTVVPQESTPVEPEVPDELAILYIMIIDCDADGYTVFTEFTAPNGVSEVLMPTWTEANGQDDLVWHKAEVNAVDPILLDKGNTAIFYVSTADHKNEHGHYITHVYVKDPTGKQVIEGIDVDVPERSTPVEPEPVQPVEPSTPAGVYVYNGLDYAPVFNPEYYFGTYPDLKQAFGNNASQAFSHFINNGINEGRRASADFSVTVYRDRYADLRNAFGSNLKLYVQHYLTNGMKEGRSGK